MLVVSVVLYTRGSKSLRIWGLWNFMASEATYLSQRNPLTKAYTAVAIAIIAATTLSITIIEIRGHGLYMTSGVWAALAIDLADGTFYRPVFGVTAAVVFFAANGRWRYALSVGTLTSVFAAAMLYVVHIASDGRALESFLACAAGGISFSDILLSPLKFLYAARIDVPFLMFFACACVAFATRRRRFTDLPSIWFVFTAIVTILIMASPGTDLSHLIDLQVASLTLAAVHVSKAAKPRALAWGLPAAGFVAAIAIIVAGIAITALQEESRWQQQDRIMEIVGEGSAPMLADDPWVPILANERPFVLDNFAMRVVSKKRPEVAEDLFAKLEKRFFRAVVLNMPRHIRDEDEATNGTWRDKRWYGELSYPEGFEEQLLKTYKPKAFIR